MVTGPDPDYSSLALRMGDAAALLEEIGTLFGYEYPADEIRWSAKELRREAQELTS